MSKNAQSFVSPGRLQKWTALSCNNLPLITRVVSTERERCSLTGNIESNLHIHCHLLFPHILCPRLVIIIVGAYCFGFRIFLLNDSVKESPRINP